MSTKYRFFTEKERQAHCKDLSKEDREIFSHYDILVYDDQTDKVRIEWVPRYSIPRNDREISESLGISAYLANKITMSAEAKLKEYLLDLPVAEYNMYREVFLKIFKKKE